MAIKTHSLQKISTKITNMAGIVNPFVSVTAVEYLVVAGGAGGGGGNGGGGGGGAGGVRTGTLGVSTSIEYTVTVGAGATASGSQGIAGNSSVFSSITS
jgi:hypothetical protein